MREANNYKKPNILHPPHTEIICHHSSIPEIRTESNLVMSQRWPVGWTCLTQLLIQSDKIRIANVTLES